MHEAHSQPSQPAYQYAQVSISNLETKRKELRLNTDSAGPEMILREPKCVTVSVITTPLLKKSEGEGHFTGPNAPP